MAQGVDWPLSSHVSMRDMPLMMDIPALSTASGNIKRPPLTTKVWPGLASLRNFDLLGNTLEYNTRVSAGTSLSLVLIRCSKLHWEPRLSEPGHRASQREEQRFHVLTLSLRL